MGILVDNRRFKVSRTLRIPLSQHIGAPCAPVVRVGDKVSTGDVIAIATGLGAPIHASANGRIKEITDKSILIETDDHSTSIPMDVPVKALTATTVKTLIEEAGIVGMGGAGFPTHKKLDIDLAGGYIIANGVECEPLLKHNIKQLEESPKAIYSGMKHAMAITNAGKGIMAIKKKNAKAIAAFKSIIIPGDNIVVAELEDMYPMGEERAVIRETLGVSLSTDQLPSAANAVVLNVETLGRIHEAVDHKRPVVSKHITVVGKLNKGRESQVFMDVPLGTTVREMLELAGGIEGGFEGGIENIGEIILGGPFTGVSAGLDDVITKTTGGIIVTMEFMKERRNMGLLVCACGGNENRLREIAGKMEANVVGVEKCKQAVETRGMLKCEDPGNCPGQAEKIMSLKRKGAEVVMISNCSDCSNTVMCVAPKLKMPVYHCTDHVMRTVGHPLVRRLKSE